MTRVDFYVLADVDTTARYRFACRLAGKATASGHGVHVHLENADAALQLDRMMWDYPDHAFLAHGIDGEPAAAGAAVVLGSSEPTPGRDRVLINLADRVPAFFGRYERVAEIVVRDDRHGARDRYRFYRDRGYPLFHHQLDEWGDR